MAAYPRLYERAAPELDALWDIRGGRTFFTGPLHYNASHRLGAPVFLAGIYGSFRLRLQGGDWQWCRTALIPAGLAHELDLGGDPLSVFYIEPNVAGADALKPLIRDTREVNGALVGTAGEIAFMRGLYEDRYHPGWSADALDDLLGFARRRSHAEPVDPRIAAAVETLCAGDVDIIPVSVLAASAGLSDSRFQHLFTQQIGVPLRRYRSWIRVRKAVCEVLKGNNFTASAHAAGFSDSAHFSREFRKTFGAAPTVGLQKLARLQRRDD